MIMIISRFFLSVNRTYVKRCKYKFISAKTSSIIVKESCFVSEDKILEQKDEDAELFCVIFVGKVERGEQKCLDTVMIYLPFPRNL